MVTIRQQLVTGKARLVSTDYTGASPIPVSYATYPLGGAHGT